MLTLYIKLNTNSTCKKKKQQSNTASCFTNNNFNKNYKEVLKINYGIKFCPFLQTKMVFPGGKKRPGRDADTSPPF